MLKSGMCEVVEHRPTLRAKLRKGATVVLQGFLNSRDELVKLPMLIEFAVLKPGELIVGSTSREPDASDERLELDA
jgi:hypothetical protein